MAKLTDTQLIVLSSALARDDGIAVVPNKMDKAAASKVAASLVARKLAREVRSKHGMPVWREDEDDRSISLMITRAGRDAIGANDEVAEKSPPASKKNSGSNRSTAKEPFGIVTTVAPRAGTKQAQVIQMLSAKTGATLEALVDATGWLPHTTRAALTALRKRGFSIERSRDGNDTSIYRIVTGAKTSAGTLTHGAQRFAAAVSSIADRHQCRCRSRAHRFNEHRGSPSAVGQTARRGAAGHTIEGSNWLQEEKAGGLSPRLRRLLAAVARNGAEPVRHLKIGSVIVREHQGVLHQVMVAPDGFCWQGKTYSSLSAIALKITGTSWNGPRFFGLRDAEEAPPGRAYQSPRAIAHLPVVDQGASVTAGSKPCRATFRTRQEREAMKPSAPKPQRCAIYTRKSTEHNLDMAFNSLDAQREACEAYIKSQAHEGWKLAPAHFDDGGLSGASLNRPALQALLDEVGTRKIDIVVVYKVDRLTRSLADFAKLVELFDEHDVSFVSVTQSFNTTSSMGRLTLNVLLSFAQFEREVIGERVRDKIAASKRKGIWVGGPIPLGYRSVDKKLEIVPDEAHLVRKIFADYLRLGSIGALAASLNGEGLRPKPRPLANGRLLAAACYRVGPLAHLLKNRFYVGEIAYRGEVHQGEHEPILDRALFETVQAGLSENAVERKTMRSRSPSILLGKIFDDRGNPMSPSHANKKGVRYRYYVSHALLQSRKDEAGSVSRIAAPDVEAIVCGVVREHLSTTDAIDHTIDRELIEARVKRIVISGSSIQIALRANASNSDDLESAIAHDDANCLTVPFRPFALPKKGIAHAPNGPTRLDPKARGTLLQAIVHARGWMDAVLNGKASSFDEIAVAEGLVERHVRRLVLLAFLSPKVIKAIADGAAPDGMTVSTLTQALPHSWSGQERMLGLD